MIYWPTLYFYNNKILNSIYINVVTSSLLYSCLGIVVVFKLCDGISGRRIITCVKNQFYAIYIIGAGLIDRCLNFVNFLGLNKMVSGSACCGPLSEAQGPGVRGQGTWYTRSNSKVPRLHHSRSD